MSNKTYPFAIRSIAVIPEELKLFHCRIVTDFHGHPRYKTEKSIMVELSNGFKFVLLSKYLRRDVNVPKDENQKHLDFTKMLSNE